MSFRFLNKCLSSVALALCVISCDNNQIEEDFLEVTPPSILFEAAENNDEIITVSTNVQTWSFVKSDWIVAEMSDSKLLVNCSDNSSYKSREGWIKISAGSAKPITVKVLQNGKDETVAPDGESVSLAVVNGTTDVKITTQEQLLIKVVASLEAPTSEPCKIRLFVDNGHLSDFNEADEYHYKKAILLSGDRITLPEECTMTIPAGRSESEVLEISVDVSDFVFDERYLLPLHLEAVENASVTDAGRADFVLVKPKPIRNLVCYEVNDTNPLNTLEYKLEDGSYFFDIVTLFSSNIISGNSGPELHNNANVQALLDNNEVYIQPLRNAGIKVYLSLLGHHTVAGLGGLTDKGARKFAEEVAEACYIYGLDGVFIDDEYSNYPDTESEWYTPRSTERAARLCYELKRAMKLKCPWETEVSVFTFGSFIEMPAVTDEGVTYQQSWFIDSLLPAYGVPSYFYGDLTRANCAFNGFELNKGNAPSGTERTAIEDGYGYCFWFAFHPSDKGGMNNNRERSLGYFRTVSQALYGLNVLDPQYYYDKLGEGSYDPTPHAI